MTTDSRALLADRGRAIASAMLISRPCQQRRSYAICRKQWPDLDVICGSQPMPLQEYIDSIGDVDRVITHAGGRHPAHLGLPAAGTCHQAICTYRCDVGLHQARRRWPYRTAAPVLVSRTRRLAGSSWTIPAAFRGSARSAARYRQAERGLTGVDELCGSVARRGTSIRIVAGSRAKSIGAIRCLLSAREALRKGRWDRVKGWELD